VPSARRASAPAVRLAPQRRDERSLAFGRVAEAARERSWERALGRLADGYRRALGEQGAAAPERRAA